MPLTRIWLALRRARDGIAIIAATYVVTVAIGIAMVHLGNQRALSFRDSLVAKAHRVDAASIADDRGDHVTAAAIDFSRNLGLAAIPETVGGLALVLPVAGAAYRGWVGGVVSVDHSHRSRLLKPRTAVYYVITMLLQLLAYTLADGAGLYLGWAYIRKRGPFVGPRWFRLPGPALKDTALLYVLIVPLFAIGSWWEFVGPAY